MYIHHLTHLLCTQWCPLEAHLDWTGDQYITDHTHAEGGIVLTMHVFIKVPGENRGLGLGG